MMKSCKFLISAVAVLLAGAGGASAQSYYGGAYGGGSYTHDSDASSSGAPGVSITAKVSPGYALGGFAGYDNGGGFRVEGELAYRRNGLDEQDVGGTIQQLQGDVAALALMVNGFYELQSGASGFTPHIGAGIGMAKVSMIDTGLVGGATESNDDTVFAYQLIAGVDYELSPTMTLFADYRLFGTTNVQYTEAGGDDIEFSYLNSAILIGISTGF